jgi:ribosomal protein L7Ae-like RNA K-turn-binding protein
MEGDVARGVLGLLGLGVRGGRVIVGVPRVREAARRGALRLAVIAPDASRHSLAKVTPLLEAKRIRIIEGPDAARLGAAVGRESTAAVGVVDSDLARGILAIVDRAPASPRGGSV